MASTQQLEALTTFMEANPELALGKCQRTTEGRSLAGSLWREVAEILNSISTETEGIRKEPKGWRLFFNEYKSRLIKKFKKGERRGNYIPLTPLQERLYTILKRDVRDSSLLATAQRLSQHCAVKGEPTSTSPTHHFEQLYTVESNMEQLAELPRPPVQRRRRAREKAPESLQQQTLLELAQDRFNATERLAAAIQQLASSQMQAAMEQARAMEQLVSSQTEAVMEQARATDRLAEAMQHLAETFANTGPPGKKKQDNMEISNSE